MDDVTASLIQTGAVGVICATALLIAKMYFASKSDKEGK